MTSSQKRERERERERERVNEDVLTIIITRMDG